MWRTIASGKVWRGELRNRAKDGSLYWVDTTIVPFLGANGKPYQYASIRYDITERKTSEARLREQASLAQLGRMAAVVAHEVRNPLAGIRGALQVIGQRMAPEATERGIVTEIVNRVDTLNAIVEDLLLFARPRPPVIRPTTFAELSAKIRTQCGNDPAFAHIEITIAEADVRMHVDPEMFTLVMLNLMNNAGQAMKGHGQIAVSVHEDGAWFDVRVADTGPGMPTDVQARLFEPFFTTKARGTGLGLATARRIIESHGGTLTLACPTTGGTVATIRLPVNHTYN
jgi:signal transduction histidine kinase